MPSATFDIGARRLADVHDLVDERDARHQGGVRGELVISAGDVRERTTGASILMELLDGVAVGVVGTRRSRCGPAPLSGRQFPRR
jgi:hypothetical protein